tara:strand:+ start:432 stop:1019 length:588 start_codon:yes stop_codon:yes gene_type:complete
MSFVDAIKNNEMYNSELTGLAKNRFTDAETQLAIANHDYRLAKNYLACNPKITQEAAEILWDHRGYVFKSELLRTGAIELDEQTYWDVYNKYFKKNSRSYWRMLGAFLGQRYWRENHGANKTPGALLEQIFNDLPEDEKRGYTVDRFIDHTNCTLKLAIKISVMKEEDNHYYGNDWKRKAQLKVAELTKKQLESA